MSMMDEVEILSAALPELEQRRGNPFIHDVLEASWYWRELGQRAWRGDTRINYPARSREELEVLKGLCERVDGESTEIQDLCRPLLNTARRLLTAVGKVAPPRKGHDGIWGIIRPHFDFLRRDFGFCENAAEPLCIVYSTGQVTLRLSHSKEAADACVFGPEPWDNRLWFRLDDLLYWAGDSRYLQIESAWSLSTPADFDRYFAFAADVFHKYGEPILRNRAGIFDELRAAQTSRDRAYSKRMDLLYRGDREQDG